MGIQINGQTDTISAVDNNFSLAGNVSIGGTLTYEDVTSVDAVGLSTFQAGIRVTGGSVGIGTDNPNRKLVISQANSTAYSGTDFDQDYHVLKLNNFTDSKTVGMQFLIGSNGEAAITATETSDGATDLAFGTRGGGNRAERLRIHSDGNVTKPSQCFVFLGMSATTISGTGNVTQDIWGVNSTYVGVDVGGDWDTSTKTFTAPVDGIYHFDWQIRYSAWTGSIYYVYQRMYTSTSPVNTGNKLCLWTPSIYNNPAGTQYYTKSMSGDMKMSAGDTVQPDFVISGSGAVTFSIDGGSVSGQCDSYLSIRLVQ